MCRREILLQSFFLILVIISVFLYSYTHIFFFVAMGLYYVGVLMLCIYVTIKHKQHRLTYEYVAPNAYTALMIFFATPILMFVVVIDESIISITISILWMLFWFPVASLLYSIFLKYIFAYNIRKSQKIKINHSESKICSILAKYIPPDISHIILSYTEEHKYLFKIEMKLCHPVNTLPFSVDETNLLFLPCCPEVFSDIAASPKHNKIFTSNITQSNIWVYNRKKNYVSQKIDLSYQIDYHSKKLIISDTNDELFVICQKHILILDIKTNENKKIYEINNSVNIAITEDEIYNLCNTGDGMVIDILDKSTGELIKSIGDYNFDNVKNMLINSDKIYILHNDTIDVFDKSNGLFIENLDSDIKFNCMTIDDDKLYASDLNINIYVYQLCQKLMNKGIIYKNIKLNLLR